jgi:hypothetical protein
VWTRQVLVQLAWRMSLEGRCPPPHFRCYNKGTPTMPPPPSCASRTFPQHFTFPLLHPLIVTCSCLCCTRLPRSSFPEVVLPFSLLL